MTDNEPVSPGAVAFVTALLTDSFATTARAEMATQGVTRETLAARIGVTLGRLAEIVPPDHNEPPHNVTLEDMARTMAALGVGCRVAAFGERTRVRPPGAEQPERAAGNGARRRFATLRESRHARG